MIFKQKETIKTFINNKFVIALAKNPMHHDRSKSVDIKVHFIWEHVKIKNVKLVHAKSDSTWHDVCKRS